MDKGEDFDRGQIMELIYGGLCADFGEGMGV